MGGRKKSPKVKKCSGCKQEHSHPFGKKCAFLVSQSSQSELEMVELGSEDLPLLDEKSNYMDGLREQIAEEKEKANKLACRQQCKELEEELASLRLSNQRAASSFGYGQAVGDLRVQDCAFPGAKVRTDYEPAGTAASLMCDHIRGGAPANTVGAAAPGLAAAAAPGHPTLPSIGGDPMPWFGGNRPAPGLGHIPAVLTPMDSESKSNRFRHWLHPSYHILSDKRYDELSYRELVYGMVCISECMARQGFPQLPVSHYLQHFKYVALKGLSAIFSAEALAKYDNMVTSKVLSGVLPSYVAADHEATYTFLSAENTIAVQKTSRKQGKYEAEKRKWFDCPRDVCARWILGICRKPDCERRHVCAACQADHRRAVCKHAESP